MPGGGEQHALVLVGDVLGVDRLDDERRAAAGREGLAEGLDRAHRVLARRRRVVVEDEQEDEALGHAERLAAVRHERRQRHRQRHADHGHRRGRRDRVVDQLRADPDLVDVVVGRAPLFREVAQLPPPERDRVAAFEEARPDLAREDGDRVPVHADDVDRERRVVGPGEGELGLLTAGRDQLALDGQAGTCAASSPPISSRAASPSPSSERKKPATFTPQSGSARSTLCERQRLGLGRQQRAGDRDARCRRGRGPSRRSRRRRGRRGSGRRCAGPGARARCARGSG